MRTAIAALRTAVPLSPRHAVAGSIVIALACAAPAVGAYSGVPVTQTYAYDAASTDTPGSYLEASAAPTVLTRDGLHAASASYLKLQDVDTEQELIDYAQALMISDTDIERIELGKHYLSMTYRSRIRVPHMGMRLVERQVYIRDDGTISVTEPWYVLLANDSDSGVRAGFSDIQIAHDGSGFTPQTEAELATRMHGRFQIGAL